MYCSSTFGLFCVSCKYDSKYPSHAFFYVIMDLPLHHICSNKIEVAYHESVALKRQEELIREEEAAWQAETDQKAKRGATEKEKKSKKKQVRF